MQRAIEDYGAAIRSDPYYPSAYSNRSFAYYKLGEYEKGIADCERSITLRPNHSTTYINRGHCFAGLGNAERAANDFRFALGRPCEPSESDRKEALDGLRSSRFRSLTIISLPFTSATQSVVACAALISTLRISAFLLPLRLLLFTNSLPQRRKGTQRYAEKKLQFRSPPAVGTARQSVE